MTTLLSKIQLMIVKRLLNNQSSLKKVTMTKNGNFVPEKTLPVNATVDKNRMTLSFNNIKGIVNITYKTTSNKKGTLSNKVTAVTHEGAQEHETESTNWSDSAQLIYNGGGEATGECTSSSLSNSSDKSSSSKSSVISSSDKSSNNISSSSKSSVIKSSTTNGNFNQRTKLPQTGESNAKDWCILGGALFFIALIFLFKAKKHQK